MKGFPFPSMSLVGTIRRFKTQLNAFDHSTGACQAPSKDRIGHAISPYAQNSRLISLDCDLVDVCVKKIARSVLCMSPIILTLGLAFISQFVIPCESRAEWTILGESHVYYTDDVALFSASRRLTRNQDPTQPAIDSELAEQGDDIAYEPVLEVKTSFGPPNRQTEISVRGQGFVFGENGRFNHGTLGLEVMQEITPATKLLFRYYFAPDLLLGENEVRTGETGGAEPLLENEVFTTNYWAAGLAQEVHEDMTAILYARYGIRRYNDAFQQRNTNFWTVGTHFEWEFSDRIDVVLGYHFERGLAEGRKQPELKDDLSYINHFVTGELEVELMKHLSLETALHYERNNWTTGIVGDLRNGQHEDIVQGDIALVYKLTHAVDVTVGFQGAHRKESFEEGLRVFNGWVGGRVLF